MAIPDVCELPARRAMPQRFGKTVRRNQPGIPCRTNDFAELPRADPRTAEPELSLSLTVRSAQIHRKLRRDVSVPLHLPLCKKLLQPFPRRRILFQSPRQEVEAEFLFIVILHNRNCGFILPCKPGVRVDMTKQRIRREIKTRRLPLPVQIRHQLMVPTVFHRRLGIAVKNERKKSEMQIDSLLLQLVDQNIPAVQHLRIDLKIRACIQTHPVEIPVRTDDAVSETPRLLSKTPRIAPEFFRQTVKPETDSIGSKQTHRNFRFLLENKRTVRPDSQSACRAGRTRHLGGKIQRASGKHDIRLETVRFPFGILPEYKGSVRLDDIAFPAVFARAGCDLQHICSRLDFHFKRGFL